MNIDEFVITTNGWGQEKVPFLFVIDFELEKPFACKLGEAKKNGILFEMGGVFNVEQKQRETSTTLIKHPISVEDYREKFDTVSRHLHYGDSFLTNLTIKTRIETDQTLEGLFNLAHARYKLLFRDNFLVFSPETFIRIKDGKIHTFPMKGTIDADLPDARKIILEDPKELAEHVTIVDLMRNDLSLVASNVTVSRFRYVEELRTISKNLLQVSSEIEGRLPDGYQDRLGSILVKLLPAGSICGAPKAKTIGIIGEAEREKRGYYTGVFGYFDGTNLESAVTIRYIEQDGGSFYYRSGGGITTQSELEKEYQEAIDKIYVPVD